MPSERSFNASNLPVEITKFEKKVPLTELFIGKPNHIKGKADNMQIFVKLLNGKTISLDVNLFDTIEKVKQKIHVREGIPSRYFHLTFCSKYLKDRYRLYNYKIQKESTIHLRLRINASSGEGPTLSSTVPVAEETPMKRTKISSSREHKVESSLKRKTSATSSSTTNKKLKRSQQPLTRKAQNRGNSYVITSEETRMESNVSPSWDSLFLRMRQCINGQEQLEKEMYNFLFSDIEQARSSMHRQLFLNLLNSAINMLTSIGEGIETVVSQTAVLSSMQSNSILEDVQMEVDASIGGWNSLFLRMMYCTNVQQQLHREVYDFLLSGMEQVRSPIAHKLFLNLLKSSINRLTSIRNGIEIAANETGSFSIDVRMTNLSV